MLVWIETETVVTLRGSFPSALGTGGASVRYILYVNIFIYVLLTRNLSRGIINLNKLYKYNVHVGTKYKAANLPIYS